MSNQEKMIWKPLKPEASQMFDFLKFAEKIATKHFETYQALHQWSIDEPKVFWGALAQYFDLQFSHPPECIVNDYKHPLEARWFEGARLNYAAHMLRHQGDKIALIAIDEQGQRKTYTFDQLKQEVAAFANALKTHQIKAGDRVTAVMPNCAETIIAFLGTASIGAIWSSCSPDFGTEAIIDRLGQVEPKLLIIADGHRYMGKTYSALEKFETIYKRIPSLEKAIVFPYLGIAKPSHHFTLWQDFLSSDTTLHFVDTPFSHPLYILFSSGTTGKPKCIIHGAGNTLIQHLKELALHTDLSEKDNLCFFTTCGWMMWNWMVSALSLGTTLILYEGAPIYPNALRLFQIIDVEKVSVFGTSAKFISTVEKENVFPAEEVSMKVLRSILSTGSPLMPHNYDFVETHIKKGVQISSISGGTDIVSCFALGNPLLPVYRGELQCLGLGLAVEVFDDKGTSIIEKKGELVCTKAFPSMPIGFWNDPLKKAYHAAYFERFEKVWAHRDYAEITAHQGLIIYGRSDAVLNPGGVRIGTAEIYRQIEDIPEIIDAIVIGQDWEDDVRIVLFVKLEDDLRLNDELKNKIRFTIKQNASPRHVPAKIIQVPDIPHTLNGKLVELAVKQTVQGEEIHHLESLANPKSLDYFKNIEELKLK